MANSTSTGARVNFVDQNVPLPALLVLDSNIIINRLYPNTNPSSRIRDTQIFLVRLERAIRQGQCQAYIPHIVLTECFHVITKKRLEAHFGTRDWSSAYKSNTQAIVTAGIPTELQRCLDSIQAMNIEFIEPEDLVDEDGTKTTLWLQTKNYMSQLSLLSSDAYILAVADRLGIRNIASDDKDFLNITGANFNIYTSPNLK